MSRFNLSSVLSIFFLSALLVTSLVFNTLKPRVMILHSYDPEYAWTRDVNVGLRRVIDKWTGYSVSWHYMDTKRHSDPNWLKRAGIVARRAIEKNDPDVLIAVDDLAQELAARFFVDKPGINIVFAGVNASIEPYGYEGASNVTGIFEHKQLKAMKETVLALASAAEQPKGNPRLVYILDSSSSLRADRGEIDNYAWSPIDYQGSREARSFEHWQQLVLTEGVKADYIMVANYRKLPLSDADSELADPKAVMKWTEANSPVPVIGINAFNVEDGAMLSVGVSPYEQGEAAARMAQAILEKGIAAGRIPVARNKQYVIALRKSALERRGVELPSVYEAFGRATKNFVE